MFNYSIEDFKYKLGLKSEGLLELQELNKQLSDVELNSYCKFDFSIVRGLEYYTGTVFEVFDTSPQNRRSIFGGGRYDDLISLFKEVKISGVGFGLGDVTFQNFLETHKLIKDLPKPKRILVISLDENSFPHSFKLAREIRSKGFNVTTYIQRHKNIKKQMKYADKMKFDIVIILGENELKEDKITLKHLPTRRQLTLSRSNYLESLKDM
jgi:histidyl-tRNA synthetase